MNKSEIKILVVDDEEYCRDFYCRFISHWGYRVKNDDGTDWPTYLTQYQPQVILMDTQLLPGFPTGDKICADIKHLRPEIGIIGMSKNQKYEQDWMKAGADAFWDKLDFKRLESTLEEVIKRYNPKDKR